MTIAPFGLEGKLGPGLQSYAVPRRLTTLSFLSPLPCRPDDVLLHRTHDEIVLLHCFLWPLVTFVVGVLIVVLTICAKSLAVKAEAMKKRKSS